jgi:hypothetical protein
MAHYFFVNTDSTSLGNTSPHDKWFQHGYAFTGGPIKYGEKLGRLSVGDTVLMYASGIGVVGIGRVLEKWDGHEHSPQLVYGTPYEDKEYRARVDWFLDLRNAPIITRYLKKTIGWTPTSAVQRIRRGAAEIQALIEGLQRKDEGVASTHVHKKLAAKDIHAASLWMKSRKEESEILCWLCLLL